jgi:hypothetical protein
VELVFEIIGTNVVELIFELIGTNLSEPRINHYTPRSTK